MKFLKFAAVLASFAIAMSASAGVVYENGALDGLYGAQQISTQQISNSFSITSAARLTGATVGLWSLPAAAPAQLTWAIGTTAFASDLGTGSTALSNAFAFYNGAYNVYASSFDLAVTLGAGDYWFTLTNGATSVGGDIFWDINFGPSQARFGDTAIDSEYFLLSGDASTDPDPGPGTNPVPEPVSIALLAAGLIGLAAARRRTVNSA